jgi:putative phosphoribosyl transferase
VERAIQVPLGALRLEGDLAIPVAAGGMVLFAHGSGSSRHSTRNRQVAGQLHRAGLGTLLLDLLTPSEERIDEQTAHFRFNIALLAERVERAARWLKTQPETRRLPLGLFGASTGAAAALVAAAEIPEAVVAVVSRGGRPDLAGPALASVRAPSLFIVGGADAHVLRLNREAIAQLNCTTELTVVPGATHLFEEPGALERVAELAAAWFQQWLVESERGAGSAAVSRGA